MSRIGIDRRSGLIYEGRGDPTYPAWPTPVVSQCTLVEFPDDYSRLPHNLEQDPFGWLFREDSFDPVSRIRRGRLFQKFGNQSWEFATVEAHPALISEGMALRDGERPRKELSVYIECTDLLMKASKGEGMQLAIGVHDAHSMWRIIQTERTVNLDVLVTLRAESAYGILPDLDVCKINPESLALISSALERVLNAAYRELPTSVVDQCRNAATVIVSRWMYQEMNSEKPIEKDLGGWMSAIREHFKDRPRRALCSALELIQVLHPRGKDNELVKMELRPVSNEDAALCVHAIGFIIREVGWARH